MTPEQKARQELSLNLFGLRDTSREDSAGLHSPDVLALDIMEDLTAALDQFSQIADGLRQKQALAGRTSELLLPQSGTIKPENSRKSKTKPRTPRWLPGCCSRE